MYMTLDPFGGQPEGMVSDISLPRGEAYISAYIYISIELPSRKGLMPL